MTPIQSEEMCKALGRVLAWDDRFFQRHPERRHRIRRAYPAEIQFHQWRGALNKPIPDCLRVYIGKRSTGPTRCVIGFMAPDAETDLSEEDAERLFQIFASHGDHSLNNPAAHISAAPSSPETRGHIE